MHGEASLRGELNREGVNYLRVLFNLGKMIVSRFSVSKKLKHKVEKLRQISKLEVIQPKIKIKYELQARE